MGLVGPSALAAVIVIHGGHDAHRLRSRSTTPRGARSSGSAGTTPGITTIMWSRGHYVRERRGYDYEPGVGIATKTTTTGTTAAGVPTR